MEIEVIEHDGKKYIKSDDVEKYIKSTVEDVKETQKQIDEATANLEAIEAEELAEQRTQQAIDLIDKYKMDRSTIDIVSVDNEEAFNESIDYLKMAATSEYGDPSAGFGEVKRSSDNTKKQLYEIGVQAYKRSRG